MPTSRRPCRETHCPNMRPCPLHPDPVSTYKQRVDDERPSAARRGYDSKWRKYRDTYLSTPRVCACGCGETVTKENGMVDHIVPVKSANDQNFWRPSNHQAMIRAHHSRKTASRDGGFGNKGGGSESLEGLI